MTFVPYIRVVESHGAARCLRKDFAIRRASVRDAFVKFSAQFYTNTGARLGAL